VTERKVLVLGAGAAGLPAAIEAHDAGADVSILEADDQIGGSLAMSGGAYYAAGSHTQSDLGIVDSVDSLYHYYMLLNHWLLEPRLIRLLCEGAVEGLDWLEEQGVVWDPDKLYIGGLETTPRAHVPAVNRPRLGPGGGGAIADALYRSVRERGIPIRTNVHVTSLVLDGEGAVVGARSESGEKFEAESVVLGTGGFAHDPELLASYFPSATVHGDWHWHWGAKYDIGDALRIGEQLGAGIASLDRGTQVLSPNFSRTLDGFMPGWLLIVNHDGLRFIDESAPYAVLGDAMNRQPDNGKCYAIVDNRVMSGDRDAEAAEAADPHGMGAGFVSNWSRESLQLQLNADAVVAATTIEGLALALGMRPRALEATVNQYNRDARAGSDSVWHKPAEHLIAVDEAPFVAVEVRAAVVGLTFTGLRINQRAQVLDQDGLPISGLFAAGDAAGGLHGERYAGSGASIAAATVFGRVAGVGAASLPIGGP
jgi:succinate dehydrogenase/fumarate reductase flavoprotein subunit